MGSKRMLLKLVHDVFSFNLFNIVGIESFADHLVIRNFVYRDMGQFGKVFGLPLSRGEFPRLIHVKPKISHVI